MEPKEQEMDAEMVKQQRCPLKPYGRSTEA